jgi:hypothetical protein
MLGFASSFVALLGSIPTCELTFKSNTMSSITYECDVTQFDVIPPKENNENIFVLNPRCLIINLMDNQKIMFQSEIEKEDAVKFAQLILFTYNQ